MVDGLCCCWSVWLLVCVVVGLCCCWSVLLLLLVCVVVVGLYRCWSVLLLVCVVVFFCCFRVSLMDKSSIILFLDPSKHNKLKIIS